MVKTLRKGGHLVQALRLGEALNNRSLRACGGPKRGCPGHTRVSTLASAGKQGSFQISSPDDALLDPLTAGVGEEPFELARESRLHFSVAARQTLRGRCVQKAAAQAIGGAPCSHPESVSQSALICGQILPRL